MHIWPAIVTDIEGSSPLTQPPNTQKKSRQRHGHDTWGPRGSHSDDRHHHVLCVVEHLVEAAPLGGLLLAVVGWAGWILLCLWQWLAIYAYWFNWPVISPPGASCIVIQYSIMLFCNYRKGHMMASSWQRVSWLIVSNMPQDRKKNQFNF